MSTRTCYDTHMSMSSYLWFSRWSAYIITYENTSYCTNWRHSIKTRLHPLTIDCSASAVFTSSGLVISNAARSCRPGVSVSSSGADTWEKNNKRALQYARWLSTLKPIYSILIHDMPTPLKYDTCGAQFSLSGSLKTHVRIHIGEKPYKRYTCGAQFSQNDRLKTHLRIHTGHKPYKYDTCGTNSQKVVTCPYPHRGETLQIWYLWCTILRKW